MNEILPDAIQSRVYGLAAQVFKIAADKLGPDSGPKTVRGWDSFAHLEFIVALEKGFRIRLKPKDILTLDSLARAERIVTDKLTAA